MSWAELRKEITRVLSLDELRTLCFDLDVDYESLLGEGKAGRARELISQMKREEKVNALIHYLNDLRPNISWRDIQLNTENFDIVVQTEIIISDDDDDDEYGMLDHLMTISNESQELVNLINKSSDYTEALTEKMEIANIQVRKRKGDISGINAIAIRMSTEITDYSAEIESVAVEFSNSWGSFYRAFLPLLNDESLISDNQAYKEQSSKFADTVLVLLPNINNLRSSIGDARTSLGKLKGITRMLTKAVTKTDRGLNRYQDALVEMVNDIQHLDAKLQSIALSLTEEE